MSSVDYAYSAPVIKVMPLLRAQFLRRTYAHLAGAILAFVGLEFALFKLGIAERYMTMSATSAWMPLLIMVGYIGASYVADWWAHSDASRGLQYAGLALYIFVLAIVFIPLLSIVNHLEVQKFNGEGRLYAQAGIMTLAVFVGLTATVFITRKDYSFLGPIVSIGCALTLGLIIAGALFGFSLGLWFSLLMVAILSASILYQTSAILYHYRTDQYVGAALGLFASAAVLFYYILRILYFSNRD